MFNLDEMTRNVVVDEDSLYLLIRLGCGSVVSLRTDSHGLHIELQEETKPLHDSRLASTSSHGTNLVVFVHPEERS